MTKISVAMCTYNGARYLADQLDSIARQDRRPDELVVCDDRSTDKTGEIVQEFARRVEFPVRFVVNDINLGSTRNFEKAIGLCSSEIIVLSDQDDVWCGDKLSRIAEAFSRGEEVGAVFTDADIVDQDLRPLGYNLWDAVFFREFERRLAANGRLFDVLLRHNVVTGATMAFLSKYRNLIVPIPRSWVHDGWIALVISAVASVTAIDKPLIQYRQHGKNQIGALRKRLIDQVRIARNTNIAVYTDLIDQYSHALFRLRNMQSEVISPSKLSKLENKVKHLAVRAKMARKLEILRMPTIALELLALRYHRYSNGWLSVARDLLHAPEL